MSNPWGLAASVAIPLLPGLGRWLKTRPLKRAISAIKSRHQPAKHATNDSGPLAPVEGEDYEDAFAERYDERTERNLATLHPAARGAARRFLAIAVPAMRDRGLTLKVISGNRTYAEQDELYAQGRTKPGAIVTNAKGGFSNHNFGIAFDIGLFQGEEYLEESPYHRICGQIGKGVGLEWGGDWASFPDEPHYQLRTGLTLAQMRARLARGEEIV